MPIILKIFYSLLILDIIAQSITLKKGVNDNFEIESVEYISIFTKRV